MGASAGSGGRSGSAGASGEQGAGCVDRAAAGQGPGASRQRGTGGCGGAGAACPALVRVDGAELGRELAEAAAPRREPEPDDPQRVSGAAQGVAARLVGPVGVVVDGVQERGDARAGGPPRHEQAVGAVQGDAAGQPDPLQQGPGRRGPFGRGTGPVPNRPRRRPGLFVVASVQPLCSAEG